MTADDPSPDDRPSMFHDGHRALQDRFDGRRVADVLETHRRVDAFLQDHVAMIEGAAFFFLATSHRGASGDSVDCSFKGGPAGFVRVTGPAMLEWPDFDGNSMYRSLGNIAASGAPGGPVGLLFMAFDGAAARLRVNGRAQLVFEHSRLEDYPGAKAMVRVEAREIFPNCPRYIPDLVSGAPSPFLPDRGRALATPDWKRRDYVRDVLPDGDPHRDADGARD